MPLFRASVEPVGQLESYRGGSQAFLDADTLDRRVQQELDAGQIHIWAAERTAQTQLARARLVMACQMLADRLVAVGLEVSPRMDSLVPQTYAQAAKIYEIMAGILAPQSVNTGLGILQAYATIAPVGTPEWPIAFPWTATGQLANEHRAALVAGLEELVSQVASYLTQDVVGIPHAYLAVAEAAGSRYVALHQAATPIFTAAKSGRYGNVDRELYRLIGEAFFLIQAVQLPELLGVSVAPDHLTGHLDLSWLKAMSIDPMSLTAPFVREEGELSADEQRELALMWYYDPDPLATVQLQEEIEVALRRRVIRAQAAEFGERCPWPAVYMAKYRVTIGGIAFASGDTFALRIELHSYRRFERRIIKTGHLEPWQMLGFSADLLAVMAGNLGQLNHPQEAKPVEKPVEPEGYLWNMTAESERARRTRGLDAATMRQIASEDPDPAQTERLWQEVQAAYRRGALRESLGDHGFSAPWSQAYVARRFITIGDMEFSPGQVFVLEVESRTTGASRFSCYLSIIDYISPAEMLGLPIWYNDVLMSLPRI